MSEILASQRQMLIRRGEPADRDTDGRMAQLFRGHLDQVKAWLATRSDMDILWVRYDAVVSNPAEEAVRLNRFLGGVLEVDKMMEVVDPALYRQRA
jgi:hypothetical protein